MRRVVAGTALLSVSIGALVASVDEAAAIRCEGRFQIVQGNPLSTPYCEDAYLATVARQYGMNVSGAAIRASETVKGQVCRLVGRDGRVSDICIGHLERIVPRF
jgi:hypothetical protein